MGVKEERRWEREREGARIWVIVVGDGGTGKFRNIGHNPNPRLGMLPTNGMSRYQVIRRLIERCIAIPFRNRSYLGTLRRSH